MADCTECGHDSDACDDKVIALTKERDLATERMKAMENSFDDVHRYADDIQVLANKYI
jgi:formate hydrogenlyase subunit 6/NADH:ubiquinone oxidoreductase subunit I